MTPEQLKSRNKKISEGQKRAWTDPEIRDRRMRAIRAFHDDPLYLAKARKNWGNRYTGKA